MFWLLFGHFIGDWGLQNRWMADNKGKYWEVLLAHSFIVTGCVCIALEYLGLYSPWKAWYLLLGHYMTDLLKCRFYEDEKDRWMLHVDHLLHFIQLLIVYNCKF